MYFNRNENDLNKVVPQFMIDRRESFPFIAYSLGITFIISMFYFVGAGALTEFIFGDEEMSIIAYLNAVAQILFMLLPVLLATIPVPLDFKEIFRLNSKIDGKILILAFIGLISFQFFVSGYAVLQETFIPESFADEYKNLREMIEKLYLSFLGGDSFFAFIRAMIVGAIVPAIAEESLFRGFLQKSLEQKLKPISAILISGVFFGLIHFNPIDMLPLMFIGFYLGYLAYASRSLWIPIIIHFANNFFAIIIIFSTDAMEFEQSTEALSTMNALIFCIIGLGITLMMCFLIHRQRKR